MHFRLYFSIHCILILKIDKILSLSSNIVLFFLNFAELPCQIRTPLTDIAAKENDAVSMNIMLSKPRIVRWKARENPIVPEDIKFKTVVGNDGLEHTLTISKVSLKENGVFTAEVDDKDYGFITSSCEVLVKGF